MRLLGALLLVSCPSWFAAGLAVRLIVDVEIPVALQVLVGFGLAFAGFMVLMKASSGTASSGKASGTTGGDESG